MSDYRDLDPHGDDPSRPCPACGAPLDLDVEGCEPHMRNRAATHEDPTVAGGPDRRRRRRRDAEPLTRADFDRWLWRRAVPALLIVAAVASLAAYLSYSAGRDSRNGLARAGVESAFSTCLSGADLRVTTAKGLDDLRSLALDPRRVPDAVAERFTRQTQPAIDALLTQAAYGTTPAERRGREFHAPLPPGAVTLEVAARVHELALERCAARVGSTFGTTATTS